MHGKWRLLPRQERRASPRRTELKSVMRRSDTGMHNCAFWLTKTELLPNASQSYRSCSALSWHSPIQVLEKIHNKMDEIIFTNQVNWVRKQYMVLIPSLLHNLWKSECTMTFFFFFAFRIALLSLKAHEAVGEPNKVISRLLSRLVNPKVSSLSQLSSWAKILSFYMEKGTTNYTINSRYHSLPRVMGPSRPRALWRQVRHWL